MFARSSLALAFAALIAAIAASLGPGEAQAGGGCHEPLTDAPGVRVDLKSACFLPSVLRVDVGATVTFTNRDAMPHTVSAVGLRSGSPNSWGSYDELAQEQSATYTFTSSGVYPYYCLVHPSMVGAVVVGDGTASRPATDASTTTGFARSTPAIGVAGSTARRSLSGEDGLPGRLAIFTAAVAAVAAALWLIARHRARSA